MDPHGMDAADPHSYSIRPSERDVYSKHSAAWQERAQRRYSLAPATIRAVPPDWEDGTVPMREVRVRETGDSPLPFSRPLPRSSRRTEAAATTAPTSPTTLSSEEEHSEPGMSYSTTATAYTTEPYPRPVFVRSRTRTLETPPRRAHAAALRQDGDGAAEAPLLFHDAFRLGSDSPSPSPPRGMPSQTGADAKSIAWRHRLRATDMPLKTASASDAAIIKVGKLMYWAAGSSASASSSTMPKGRRPRLGQHSWQAISAVLRENGELKLFDAADVSFLAVIHLSHLSRRAIQQVHASIFDDQFCIAIYPQYAIYPAAMAPARPLYLSVESRVLFEAWWVLLRVFAIPELYGPSPALSLDYDARGSGVGYNAAHVAPSDMFRLERSVFLRIIEARLRPPRPRTVPERNTPAAAATTTTTAATEKDPLSALSGRYFSEVMMEGVTRARTVVRDDPSDLFWREDFDFAEVSSGLLDATIILKKEAIEASAAKAPIESPASVAREGPSIAVYGTVRLPLDYARQQDDDVEKRYPIVNQDRDVVGDMLVRLRVDEVTILLLHEYRPLSELLHRFSSGLTAQIALLLPRRLQRLSEILVNIFQATGRIKEWLMVEAEKEIESAYKSKAASNAHLMNRIAAAKSPAASSSSYPSISSSVSSSSSSSPSSASSAYESPSERELAAHELGKAAATEVSLLFRGNTLLTRSMDLYMRRAGKDYLDEILRDVLAEIDAGRYECEVDPSRLPGSAAPDVLARNWATLVRCFRSVWSVIRDSAARCPLEMRMLLQHVRACCESRFGSFHHTVRYSSVSGFLFLRFFCPAVLNPKLFGLLRDHPRPAMQRTFTLIAKSLQGLANMSNFGAKERWMEPMNNHLVVHRQELRQFIDAVCAVPPDAGPPMVPPSYTTPRTILARLPPAHAEGFPSLPYLIDEARNYAALVSLWLDAGPNHASAAGGSGGGGGGGGGGSGAAPSAADLAFFHQLCLDVRRRTRFLVAQAGQRRRNASS